MSFRFFNKNKKQKTNQHNSLGKSAQAEPVNSVKLHEIKRAQLNTEDQLDAEFGYSRYTESTPLAAFIFNIRETFVIDEETNEEFQACDIYSLQEDGTTFKTTYIYNPYLLLKVKDSQPLPEVEEWMNRYFQGLVYRVEEVVKEDLDLPNHLSGKRQRYIKLVVRTTMDLMALRRELNKLINTNKIMTQTQAQYSLDGLFQDTSHEANFGGAGLYNSAGHSSSNAGNSAGSVELAREKETLQKILGDKRQAHEKITDNFIELREFDVPYLQRICIDTGLRAGLWYDFFVAAGQHSCTFNPRKDLESRPQMRILAYDIETCKAPLKFPNSQVDQIMMISLMCDGHGYLFTNRTIVSEDVQDFEYTPKPEYEGPFTIVNCTNERTMLEAFLAYIKKVKPQIIVSYNGDFFDFPYVDARCQKYNISLEKEIAMFVQADAMSSEYKGRFIVHLDAYHWVQRDSYLPQGSQGLKAVTKAKLKYNPVELDPEDMMPFARTKPKLLAQYSVSDAVATYYLYLKYVHLFIFSLCTIIPLTPNEVLRKGSGTLCETLLMVQARDHNVIAPNKQMDDLLKFYKGHLLESETYVGAHVECLHSGVYRADIPIKFELKTAKLQELMDTVDSTVRFAIEKEWLKKVEDVTNFEEIKTKIFNSLKHLYDNPVSYIKPLIYHLDVGAMYPNIILTNRLQPYAVVDETICATCDYNIPNALCKRTLEWTWRGKYFVPTKADYTQIRKSLEVEPLSAADREKYGVKNTATFLDLHKQQQAEIITNRVKTYARKVYRKLTEEKIENRLATTCQKEHPFYIDTVRAFRDRRYLYKELNKTWGNNLTQAKKEGNALREAQCKDMILLYDSMQLAHKCILNSFYGYVMRKGSRWSSMPMAGVVTRTGSKLIQRAEDLVCAVGKVLELDTDGIWCVLPENFPENFKFQHKNGSVFKMNYPCSVLNHQVDDKHTNHQYHQLPEGWATTEEYKQGKPPQYNIVSECSIFFEVDGPYKAMVLPASQHEGENIKKRYAVFNFDGSLAELKGFEIKRRGELQLIKVFQEDVFKVFLKGTSLLECYQHVGAAANKWLDVLFSRGQDLEDSVVFDLISENKSMSEKLEDYGDARSTSITCAKRLGEFLGPEMVKDKGLNCHFVIVKYPIGAPVSERAVPVKIWESEPNLKKYYLRQWLNESSLTDFDIRSLLDWEYYTTRLNSAIQKIITIPAAFQEILNPVPRVVHPDWLVKKLKKESEPQDKNIIQMFGGKTKNDNNNNNNDDEQLQLEHKSVQKNNNQNNQNKKPSPFDEFDDIEDFSGKNNNNKNTKLTGLFKNRKQASVVVIDGKNDDMLDDNDDNDDDNDNNDEDDKAIQLYKRRLAAAGGSIDDEDILNQLQDHAHPYQQDENGQMLSFSQQLRELNENDDITTTTTTTTTTTSKTTNVLEQAKKHKPGSAAWVKALRGVWIAEAAERRALRKKENPHELTTAAMVRLIDEKERRAYENKLKQQRRELRVLLGQEDENDNNNDENNNNEDLEDDDLMDDPSKVNKKTPKKNKNKNNNFIELDGDDDDFFMNNNNNDQNNKDSVDAMLEHLEKNENRKQQQVLAQHKTWHVLYVQPHPAQHGVFNVWVVVEQPITTYDTKLKKQVTKNTTKTHKIQIKMDRQILIHAYQPFAPFHGNELEVDKILPGGVQRKHLYQINMEEAIWQQQKVSILEELHSNKEIEGVYQHDLSLLFKAILELGNIVHGLDEKLVEYDPHTKRALPKIWDIQELINHGNNSHNNHFQHQTNDTDKYLLTPQDLYMKYYSLQQTNNHAKQQPPQHTPILNPLLIFHRESNDLYLNSFPTKLLIDKQRVFFGIFDPTQLELVIIAGGPGAKSFGEDVKKQSATQHTAQHLKSLYEHAQEEFLSWFISSHIPDVIEKLQNDPDYQNYMEKFAGYGIGGSGSGDWSEFNFTQHLLQKLKISHFFTQNASDAYKRLSTWLDDRSMDGIVPILPILDTTQDMNLITTLHYQQLQQELQQQQQQLLNNNANNNNNINTTTQTINTDFSLSCITQKYPFIFTHSPLTTTLLPQQQNNNLNNLDNNITMTTDNPFITLQWIANSITSMHSNISNLYQNFQQRLQLSRLMKIPLCNIPQDLTLYVLDILFARALNQSKHVLWTNPNSTIDIAGNLQLSNNITAVVPFNSILEQNLFQNHNDHGGTTSINTKANDLDLLNPQLIIPGCYRNICFDLDLHNFSLNTFLNYQHLPDQLENDTVVSIHNNNNNNQNNNNTDENGNPIQNNNNNNQQSNVVTGSDPSSVLFLLLRNVVLQLLGYKDKFLRFQHAFHHQIKTPGATSSLSKNKSHHNILVQQNNILIKENILYYKQQRQHIILLLENIYRYITSSQYAMLYDHLLHMYMHKLMKKTLVTLVKEISKLHLNIVLASFERLILSTDKTQYDVAYNRINSVCTYLRGLPLFNKIEFKATNYYFSLLFMDVYNFTAILPNHDYNPVQIVLEDDNVNADNQYDHQNQQQQEENQLLLPKTKKVKKSRFADSDGEDENDDFFNDDEERIDGSVVDVDGEVLEKQMKKKKMEQLIASGAVDFGQFNKNNNADDYEGNPFMTDTLPIYNDDILPDDGIENDDEKLVQLQKTFKKKKNKKDKKRGDDDSDIEMTTTTTTTKTKLSAKFRGDSSSEEEEDDGYYDDSSEVDYDEYEESDEDGLTSKPKRKKPLYERDFFDDANNFATQKTLKYKKDAMKNKKFSKKDLQAIALQQSQQFDDDDDFGGYNNNNNNNTNNNNQQQQQSEKLNYFEQQRQQQQQQEEQEMLNNANQSPWLITSEWNIATFLPVYAEQIFKDMVEAFLLYPFIEFDVTEQEYITSLKTGQTSGGTAELFEKIAQQEEGNNNNNNNNPNNQMQQQDNTTFYTIEPKKRHDWYKQHLLHYTKTDLQSILLAHISQLQGLQHEHISTLRQEYIRQQIILQGGDYYSNNKNKADGGDQTAEFLKNHQTPHINNDSAFPKRPGKHLEMTSVALEYIKMFCHVLSLDPYIKEEVLNVKSSCLAKLQIQAFTDASHYKQPCRTFILPNVCCTKCGYTKDIDLCRDFSLFYGSNSHNYNNNNHLTEYSTSPWSCQKCHNKYNKYEIECRLIHIVQQVIAQYLQQDFMCTKCKQMKAETLTSDCTKCCIPYVQTRTYTQQKNIFISLQNIARQHNFMFLADMLTWVLRRR